MIANLDDTAVYQRYDASGMLMHLHQFPEQCRLAWQKVSRFDLPEEYTHINKIIILGMGGSAIGGDVVKALASTESKVPTWVQRDYDLPPFVDEKTMVIASSYSGNTEETLSAFGKSLQTRAKKLVITTGGKLGQLAKENNLPTLTIDYKAPPRAAFAHSFVPLLGILQKIKVISDKSTEFKIALQSLNTLSKELAETNPSTSNSAKQLATRLAGRIAVVYGAEMLSVVAQRWKTQINENSKAWAFHESFPELNHNAVVGYQFPSPLKDAFFVVLLHSSLLHPRIQLRYEATTQLLSKAGIGYELVKTKEPNPLAQIMSLIFLGDYVSFYLSMLYQIDPTPVESIDFLKGYLARL